MVKMNSSCFLQIKLKYEVFFYQRYLIVVELLQLLLLTELVVFQQVVLCSVDTGAEGSLCLSVIDERVDNEIFSFDSFIIDGREEFASVIEFSDT